MSGSGHSGCWEQINDVLSETEEILRIRDTLDRNKVISGRYATAYVNREVLLWAGAAAFASTQAGHRMKLATAFSSWRWLGPMLAICVRQPLETGNAVIFRDIYPSLVFASLHGVKRLLDCMDEWKLPVRITLAYRAIDSNDLETAAKLMAKHEQADVIVECLSDQHFRFFLDIQRRLYHLFLRCTTERLRQHVLGSMERFLTPHFGFVAHCWGAVPPFIVEWRITDGLLYEDDRRVEFAERVVDVFRALVSNPMTNARIRAHLQLIQKRGIK